VLRLATRSYPRTQILYSKATSTQLSPSLGHFISTIQECEDESKNEDNDENGASGDENEDDGEDNYDKKDGGGDETENDDEEDDDDVEEGGEWLEEEEEEEEEEEPLHCAVTIGHVLDDGTIEATLVSGDLQQTVSIPEPFRRTNSKPTFLSYEERLSEVGCLLIL